MKSPILSLLLMISGVNVIILSTFHIFLSDIHILKLYFLATYIIHFLCFNHVYIFFFKFNISPLIYILFFIFSTFFFGRFNSMFIYFCSNILKELNEYFLLYLSVTSISSYLICSYCLF